MKNKKFNFILLFALTALVLYYTLRENFDDVMLNILNMKPIWILFSILLMMLYWGFKALITANYVRYYKKDYQFLY